MPDQEEPGIYKLSTIVASTRDSGTESFQNLDEMPPVLRANCVRALNSTGTVTVVIADSGGREYLRQMMSSQTSSGSPAAPTSPSFPWRLAAEIIFVAGAGLALWVLVTLR